MPEKTITHDKAPDNSLVMSLCTGKLANITCIVLFFASNL